MKFKNEIQNSSPYYEEPHYSVVPAPRYWNTLKTNKNDQCEDVMGNSLSPHELVSYNNIDFTNAQQKIMSLSIGPTTNVSHGTQTDMNASSTQNQNYSNNNLMTSSIFTQPNVFNVQLHPNGGPLGITLAGNEDGQKPIVISGLQEGGVAFNTGQIQVGDVLLAINNESVIGIPLSSATKLLQIQNEVIELRLSRSNRATNSTMAAEKLPQPQVLYAEVQRRPNNLSKADAMSNSSSNSRSGSNNSDTQLKTIHVTLYKDQGKDWREKKQFKIFNILMFLKFMMTMDSQYLMASTNGVYTLTESDPEDLQIKLVF